MKMFNKLIRFIKNWGSYDIYVAYFFRLRSMVARNNEQQSRKRPLLYERNVLCTPSLLSFNEIPKYRGIDKLNTTLHLIINKFIENQQKTGLNFDFITNLGRFLTNNFTTKQQISPHSMAQSLGRGCHQNKEIVQ